MHCFVFECLSFMYIGFIFHLFLCYFKNLNFKTISNLWKCCKNNTKNSSISILKLLASSFSLPVYL